MAVLDESETRQLHGLSELLQTAANGDSAYSNEKKSNILNLMLTAHLSGIQPIHDANQPSRQIKLQRLLLWINRNLDGPLDIDSLAKKMHMSRSTFTRSFKDYTNMSVTNYVCNARLNFASTLLAERKHSIDEVARRCGYRNLGHFYKQFQEQFNMTPSQYRKVSLEMTIL